MTRILLAGAVLIALAATACGGGDVADPTPRVTDPAAVPTATPIRNGSPTLYQIKDGVVSTTGGQAALPSTTVPAGGAASNYEVQDGDTCSAIADQFGISVEELRRVNRDINEDCTNLGAGDVLRIPTAAATPIMIGGGTVVPGRTSTPPAGASGDVYVVSSGDTCESIADALGTTSDELKAANPEINEDCTNLDIDQELAVP